MEKTVFLDSTKPSCWGWRPEPENHDAFVGWRAIIEHVNGSMRLDYLPDRCSCRGMKKYCDRLTKWWTNGRNSPEKWWIRNCACNPGPSVREISDGEFRFMAVVNRSDDYAYISLYLDRLDREREFTVSMKVEGRVDVTVTAKSFEEAFEKAQQEEYDPADVHYIEYEPVNATNDRGELKDYE